MNTKSHEYEQQATDWFHDRYLAVHTQAHRYWLLLLLLSGLLLTFLMAFILLLPLKQTVMEPYVLLVDNLTGITSTLTPASAEDLSQHTPVVKYFLSKYVQAHDGYSQATAKSQYQLVRAFSSPEVFSTFQEDWNNPDLEELVNTLGSQGRLAVEIMSITFPQTDIAHVRYVQTITRLGVVLKRSTWLATLKLEQLAEIDESLALINPLGLVITRYQRVRESEDETV